MTATKRKWSWKTWLRRVDAAPLTDAEKQTARDFRTACKRPRWLPYYEAEWVRDEPDTLKNLHRLCQVNLACYQQGHFAPALGPRLPVARSIVLTPDERRILSLMARLGGERGLYRILKHGHIDQPSDRRVWRFSPWNCTGSQCVPTSAARRLARLGIIEDNGCTIGGRRWTHEYRIARHRLYAVANLPRRLQKICKQTKRSA